MTNGKRIRVYSPFEPNSRTEGAFHVIANQVEALRQLGCQVDLICWKNRDEKESTPKKIKRVVQSLLSDTASPELFHYPPSADLRHHWDKVADYGIYHFSFAHSWLREKSLRSEKKTVVHFHNLESELFRLRSVSQERPSRLQQWIHNQNAQKLQRHELELAQLADELWFLSEVDRKMIEAQLPGKDFKKTRLVAPGFTSQVFQKRQQAFLNKPSSNNLILGLVGRFDFGPNQASLEWMIHKLAPELQIRHFKGQIQVVGKHVPSHFKEKAKKFDFIQFLGFVPNLEGFYSELSFMLVPHLCGSGVRIKLLEAISSGIPVFANEDALSPLDPTLRHSRWVICANSPVTWAERLVCEKPFEYRHSCLKLGFHPALDGLHRYRFVLVD